MIVTCPYCATRYEIDAARVAGPSPMMKCSRCRHIFPAPSSQKASPSSAPPARPRRPDDEANLTLPFDETGWKDEAAPPAFDVSEPEERFTLGTEGDAATPAPHPGAAPKAPAPPAAPLRAAASRGTPPPADEVAAGDDLGMAAAGEEELEEEDDLSGGEEEEAPRPRPPRRRARPAREGASLGALFVFLGLVVAGYAVLTRALFASPALCDRLVGRLPLVGTFGDDRLLTRKVALSDVTGSYQRIKDGKDVFVITGKAINTAPVALHGVQITGTLYSQAGQTLDDKTIYCGNVVSTKVLKDLTPRELSILQKLSPPKQFVIEPGESSTFVIVFMDPPRQAAQFVARVAAAQRQA